MQTQHITQTQLASGLLSLTPDEGYTLFDGKSHRTFPTADIYADDLPNWSAVAVDSEAVEEEPAVEAPVVEEPVEEAPAPKKRSSKK